MSDELFPPEWAAIIYFRSLTKMIEEVKRSGEEISPELHGELTRLYEKCGTELEKVLNDPNDATVIDPEAN